MSVTNSHINELIENYNPFAGNIVVRTAQIWGKSFPDAASINAHASNAVFDAVEKVCQGERETVGITITAEKGLGKSHIISRIRHHLQADNKTLFIYMSKYDNLNQIQYNFLESVASSLRVFSNQKVMQWQEIAAALINEAKHWNCTPQQYINWFPTWLDQHSNKVVEMLTKDILQAKPAITNPYLVQAILWTLSSEHVNYANYWLSGSELTQTQAEFMGLPNPKNEDREANGLSNVRQVLDIISNYRIPVICFDELDIAEVSDNGFTAAQVVASLAKDLYNTLTKGVLLLAMYPETWNDQIRFLPQAEAVIDRLASEQVDRQPITLKYLNSDDIVSLVEQWLKDFYHTHQIVPPHPLYPFDENQLRNLGRSKPTVRSILKWCADNLLPGIVVPETVIINHPVEPYFQQELAKVEASIYSLFENEAAIADALYLGFATLIGETVEGVKIEDVKKLEDTPGHQHQYIDFKIIGNQGKVKIGVDTIQQSNGRYIGDALKRLIDYEKFDLTRGCLIRSKPINAAAVVAQECLRKLSKQLGGKWVALRQEDIKPLLAISFVYQNKINELNNQKIVDFIQQNKLVINNPLIREIIR
ncbi:MAG: hypothetical protein QNJ47_02395 [Nostocaceae cyanobacterium]|nr:hypothetical protein [Nostocaceae cyanobacterium]